MSNPTTVVPTEQARAFGRAVCERLGIDPAIVGEKIDFQVTGGDDLGSVTLTAYLPAEELLAMFNAAGSA